ncbi:hypothetical protein HK098_007285 [Nowakowskiella sp. JEL0407]|nr:hypothetical protein HK098_007273 [Nowakowskiella sp. JEL0407]KAJ3126691.1 hypothetical protein HK098_007285 [Nowakowskiella sp. JEL0407]
MAGILLTLEPDEYNVHDIAEDGTETCTPSLTPDEILADNISRLALNTSPLSNESAKANIPLPELPTRELIPKIFYALEEIKLTYDLVTLLTTPNSSSQTTPISGLVGVGGEHAFNHLSISQTPRPPPKSFQTQIESLQHLVSSKRYLSDSVASHLQSASVRLQKAIDEEHFFYHTYWIPLLEMNWILQLKRQGGLCIDYGFRKNGSWFDERSDAEIFRGGNEVEVAIVHSEEKVVTFSVGDHVPQRTVYSANSGKTDEMNTLSVHNQLMMKEVSLNLKKYKGCKVLADSIQIPISKVGKLKISLIETTSVEENNLGVANGMDVDGEEEVEMGRSVDYFEKFTELVAESSLRKIHHDNFRNKRSKRVNIVDKVVGITKFREFLANVTKVLHNSQTLSSRSIQKSKDGLICAKWTVRKMNNVIWLFLTAIENEGLEISNVNGGTVTFSDHAQGLSFLEKELKRA